MERRLAARDIAFDPLPLDSSGWTRLWKGAGVVLLLLGAVQIVGVATGGRDVLQPLQQLAVRPATGAPLVAQDAPQERRWLKVASIAELDAALRNAQGKTATVEKELAVVASYLPPPDPHNMAYIAERVKRDNPEEYKRAMEAGAKLLAVIDASWAKAEADAASVDVARFVEAIEGPEHVLVFVRRNARSVIVDRNLHRGDTALGMQFGPMAVAQCVGHQVGQAALHGERPELDMHVSLPADRDVGVVATRIGGDVLQDFPEIDRSRLLVAFPASEGEIALDHALHIGDVVR